MAADNDKPGGLIPGAGNEDPAGGGDTTRPEPPRQLTPAARRALAEAAERRRQHDAEAAKAGAGPKEVGGTKGPDPVRYGDWENKGRVSDF